MSNDKKKDKLPEGVVQLNLDNVEDLHNTLAEMFGEPTVGHAEGSGEASATAIPPSVRSIDPEEEVVDFTYAGDHVAAAIWSDKGLAHNLRFGKFDDEAIMSRLKNTQPYRWGLNDFLYAMARFHQFQGGEQEYLQAMMVEWLKVLPLRTASGHMDKNFIHTAAQELTEAQIEELLDFTKLTLKWKRTE